MARRHGRVENFPRRMSPLPSDPPDARSPHRRCGQRRARRAQNSTGPTHESAGVLGPRARSGDGVHCRLDPAKELAHSEAVLSLYAFSVRLNVLEVLDVLSWRPRNHARRSIARTYLVAVMKKRAGFIGCVEARLDRGRQKPEHDGGEGREQGDPAARVRSVARSMVSGRRISLISDDRAHAQEEHPDIGRAC